MAGNSTDGAVTDKTARSGNVALLGGSPVASAYPTRHEPENDTESGGGGRSVIAKAPNPAGLSILKLRFDEETISPPDLLFTAIPPSLVAVCPFSGLEKLF